MKYVTYCTYGCMHSNDSVSYHSVSGVTNMRAVNDMERVARARVQQADQLGLADLAIFHASC